MKFKVDEVIRKFLHVLSKRRKTDVTIDELIIFTDQTYAMVKAGITLSTSMAFLQKHTDNVTLKDAFYTMSIQLEKGMPLSKALADNPEIFPEYYVKNIRAAEVAGVVPEILQMLSKYLKNQKKLKYQVKKTFLYPKIVFFAIIFGSVLLAIFQEKVEITQKNIIILIALFILTLFLYEFVKSYFSEGKGKEIWDRLRLEIWFFGKIYKNILNKQFAEIFIPLYKSGLPITEVFHLIGDAIENKVYAFEVINIGKRIEEGESVADSVSKCSFFPIELINNYRIGETTGEYEKNLDLYLLKSGLDIELALKTAIYVIYIISLLLLVVLIILMIKEFSIPLL